jgi:thiamine biosynthesis protein ThiS
MNILKINGAEKEFETLPKTLIELLDQMKINQATIVAEIDGEIIARENFNQTPINANQQIELIRFVGGG